jgi:dsRNA-specific ribonuclease
MIGVDYLLQTEEENNIADALDDLMSPIEEEREEAKAQRAAEREAEKALEREAKVQHMKDVKQQVKESAMSKAEEMDAYIMLSFSSWSAKAEFCERFGYPAEMKIIKGEVFAEQVERID